MDTFDFSNDFSSSYMSEGTPMSAYGSGRDSYSPTRPAEMFEGPSASRSYGSSPSPQREDSYSSSDDLFFLGEERETPFSGSPSFLTRPGIYLLTLNDVSFPDDPNGPFSLMFSAKENEDSGETYYLKQMVFSPMGGSFETSQVHLRRFCNNLILFFKCLDIPMSPKETSSWSDYKTVLKEYFVEAIGKTLWGKILPSSKNKPFLGLKLTYRGILAPFRPGEPTSLSMSDYDNFYVREWEAGQEEKKAQDTADKGNSWNY